MNLRSISVLTYICFLQASNVNPQLMCQSNDRPQIVDFVVDDYVPFIAPLDKGLPTGSVLTLEATVPKGAQEFSLELLAPDNVRFVEVAPLALSVRARFDTLEVYHNSYLKEAWGQREIPYWFPLRRGGDFNFTFQSDEKGFKIDVNGALFWMFFHRVHPKNISHVRVTGDIALTRLTYQVGEEKSCRARPDLRAEELQIKGAAPYVAELNHPFSTHSSIRVTGTLHHSAEWMVVHLQSDDNTEEVIVLQFLINLRENTVIQNTYFNGIWGWEYSNDSVPVKPGAEFNIMFHCQDRHIKICINGVHFSRYEHRLNPERVTKVFVNGPLSLKSVIHYTNGTRNTTPVESFRSCSPLAATAGFKHILCELCTRLPEPDLSVITPLRFRRNIQQP